MDHYRFSIRLAGTDLMMAVMMMMYDDGKKIMLILEVLMDNTY